MIGSAWLFLSTVVFCPVFGARCWAGGAGLALSLYLWYLHCPWDFPGSCMRWTLGKLLAFWCWCLRTFGR